MTKSPPRVIAFDGDDTLWHNETVFVITQHEFRALVLRHADLPYEEIDARLVATERQPHRLWLRDQGLCALYDRDGHRGD